MMAPPPVPPDEVNNSIRDCAEWLEELIRNRILGARPYTCIQERLREIWNVSEVSEDLAGRFRCVVNARLNDPAWPSWKRFRMFQWISYVLLGLFFLTAFLNQGIWQEAAPYAGGSLLYNLAGMILKTLVSTTGFAAVACCALLYLFLGFRFHCRHQELIRRESEKFMQAVKLELVKEWESQWDTLMARLVNLRRSIAP